jgi:hypothetical protein
MLPRLVIAGAIGSLLLMTAAAEAKPLPLLSSARWNAVLDRIRSADRAELFFLPWENSIVARPLNSAEYGARCLITDRADVGKLVAIASRLKISREEWGSFESVLEIRLLKGDRLLSKMMFTDGGTRDAQNELITYAAVDGRRVVFYEFTVDDMLAFAETRMSGESKGQGCAEFVEHNKP